MKTKIFTIAMLAFLSFSKMNAQIGVGTQTPHQSAILELESTNKGFLPPRMTTAQRNEINNPENGLVIYNTTQNCLNMWIGYWRNFCPYAGVNEVSSPASGLVWMDRNLGASRVANSRSDIDGLGHLFQWGRAADGHQIRTSQDYTVVQTTDGVANFNNNLSSDWHGRFIVRNSNANNWVNPSVNGVDDLWQGVNGTNNPCPTGYRIPTEAEWQAEFSTWSNPTNDWRHAAFASPLKLPIGGFRWGNSGLLESPIGTTAYWSSTISGTGSIRFRARSGDVLTGINPRANGLSVRCLRD
jgi:hypothetical protein